VNEARSLSFPTTGFGISGVESLASIASKLMMTTIIIKTILGQ
jgi:hypothetical protein